MFWFEFGGNKIGHIMYEQEQPEEKPKWKLIGKYKHEFPCHFAMVFIDEKQGYYLLGGMGNNCMQYINKNIVTKAVMPTEKSFFATVYHPF